MQCFVYKSRKKLNTYLYVLEKDDFGAIPEALQKLMGDMAFVLSFDLEKQNKLASEDIQVVRKNLADQGFHLQLPDQTKASDQDIQQVLLKH